MDYIACFYDGFWWVGIAEDVSELDIKWEKKHDAFNMLKRELSSESVLAFYDPHKEVQLITDASNHAIGGILLQKEGTWSKPICYISRSLTAAELKYSITEKKALALVWAIEKLHLYLYGKNFKAYNLDVTYQKGEKNIADFISRSCTPNEIHSESDKNEITAYVNFLVKKMVPKSISLEDIKTETATDINLITVKTALLSGKWHDNPILEPYRKFQNELIDHDGIILRGEKIVLPKTLQKRALQIVHEGHLSVEKCKGLLRQKVYWVTMNTDREVYIKK
ncbi:uncharacterized protein LOC124816002 [Hydra vulgaris]|uniref:uncharacterized protein LOC124816002 n=1 Tax=Hydra vulgaris TaxID=6087 RepID=UPI001F5E588A|nr:uncharacterized protein LOC124816002 [Hydra vulgaris]